MSYAELAVSVPSGADSAIAPVRRFLWIEFVDSLPCRVVEARCLRREFRLDARDDNHIGLYEAQDLKTLDIQTIPECSRPLARDTLLCVLATSQPFAAYLLLPTNNGRGMYTNGYSQNHKYVL
ncbi:hypothetical protein DBV15_06667 [Temnothorax longispinosus]|uniref:Uncharacterized protein n=1 Tax=Temnothorax longispinosus TaxID=300112 RepID=A0A4S2KHK9_9HYME|nr:hypothetical protein DBV15_06667 [Temnothorax longispinosus]